jgi:hypothetical protein
MFFEVYRRKIISKTDHLATLVRTRHVTDSLATVIIALVGWLVDWFQLESSKHRFFVQQTVSAAGVSNAATDMREKILPLLLLAAG